VLLVGANQEFIICSAPSDRQLVLCHLWPRPMFLFQISILSGKSDDDGGFHEENIKCYRDNINPNALIKPPSSG